MEWLYHNLSIPSRSILYHDLSYSVFPNVNYLTSTSLNMITRMVSVGSTQLILRLYWNRISRQVLTCVRWSILCLLSACVYISFHKVLIQSWLAGLGSSVGCAVRLETRRSRVQPPPISATFFRGDWSWNIFYGHSLPSADSRRAVAVSGERMCTILVNSFED